MAISKDCSFLPPPRILTFGRILFSFLAVFVLTVFVNAQDTVSRTNASGTVTGTDVATVQMADGAAEGDVLTISGTSTHNSNVTPVHTFTIQSANSTVQTINAGNISLYTLSDSGEYNITLSNLDYKGYASAISGIPGLFMHTTQGSTLNINTDKVSFKGFNASNKSGGVFAVDGDGNLNITATNGLLFDSNRANENGGAILMTTGALNIDADTLTFSNNYAAKRGAGIRSESSISLTGNNILFSGNTVGSSGNGGGIQTLGTLTIKGKGENSTITFENNNGGGMGGAFTAYDINLSTGSFFFDQNKTTSGGSGARGGAIVASKAFTVTDVKTLSFTKNSSYSKAGALYAGGNVSITAQNVIFDSNQNNGTGSNGLGGGIHADGGSITINAGSISFKNNIAKYQGGAIYCTSSVTFSGENAVAEFSGNSAANAGNDLYLSGTGGLTFQDNGTYSFDGGIYINNTNKPNTVINQAQVTIAGRENDNTNIYQLQDIYISNGGSLTANLDYIDSLTGTFNVGTADTAGTLELNVSEDVVKKLNAASLKVIRTDLGEVIKTGDGTLQLCNEAQDLIDINGLVVSSGRMDILGYMTGGITVEPDSVFSPGNSVGDARFGGGYELKEGATLLIEQEGDRIDTLTASSFVIDSNSIIDIVADSLQPGAEYPIIVNSSGAFSGDLQNDNYWNGLLTPGSDYYWNLSVRGDTVYASVDANAVPEPSTWALLALGVVVLFLRKRKN